MCWNRSLSAFCWWFSWWRVRNLRFWCYRHDSGHSVRWLPTSWGLSSRVCSWKLICYRFKWSLLERQVTTKNERTVCLDKLHTLTVCNSCFHSNLDMCRSSPSNTCNLIGHHSITSCSPVTCMHQTGHTVYWSIHLKHCSGNVMPTTYLPYLYACAGTPTDYSLSIMFTLMRHWKEYIKY